MNTLLIFILIGLIIAIATIASNWRTYEDNWNELRDTTISQRLWMCIWRPIMGILGGIIVGSIVAIFIGLFFQKKHVVTRTTQIYAIEDVFGGEGSCFLGTGHIETVPYYFYYYKTENGLSLGKLESLSEEVYLIQKDSTLPRIEYLNPKFVNPKTWLWAIETGDELKRIIVPTNSIKNNFNFDLK